MPSSLRICPHMQYAIGAKHKVHKLAGSWLDKEMSGPHLL